MKNRFFVLFQDYSNYNISCRHFLIRKGAAMWQDYHITAEDIPLYQTLIPDFYIRQLKEGSLAGLVFINQDSMTNPVIGIVLYRVTKGYIEIEWVVPTADYDLPDYGADMVRSVLNKARIQGGYRGVIGRFRKGDAMAEFFPEDEFSYVTEPAGVYRFRLSDVTGLEKYRDNKRLENCISLSASDKALKNSILTRIAMDEEIIPLSSSVNWDAYEQDLSFIYRGENGGDGIILVEASEDELVLSLLYSRNPVAGILLLTKACDAAADKYGADKAVACPVLTELSERIIEKTIPNPVRPKLIRAEALLPVGTGLIQDFITYHSSAKHASDIQGT